ncbi:MAG: GAF domain-containing protein [Chloroflexi bacterium]|nr:GAF domain-containing protein [Chloroflexota bacterium]
MSETSQEEDAGVTGEAPMGLLANLPCLAYRCLLDEQHTMLFVSQGCVVLTGYQASDLLGQGAARYRNLVLPEERPGLFREINLAVKAKRRYRHVYRIRTADQRERWVREEGSAVYGADGSIKFLQGIVTDHGEQMAEFDLLEQRVADRTRRLTALYDILEAAAEGASTQKTVARILERVLKAIGVKAGAIHLLDGRGEQLQLVAHHGFSEDLLREINMLSLQESPLAGWVVRHGDPLFIPHLIEDSRASSLAARGSDGAYAGIPISASEQFFGVLSVLSDDAPRFTVQEEIDLLVSVGEQIGVVIENAHLRRQAEQLMIIDERNRLARELHDSVTQSLYSVTLFAEAGRRMVAAGEYDQAIAYLGDVSETSRQTLKEMRLLVHRLRPSLLAKEGLVRALQHRLNAVEGRVGIDHRLVVEGDLNLTPALEEALYYIAQEALNNALKHADASEVMVELRGHEGGDIELKIIDNGCGFDPLLVAEAGGLGLTSMRERADMFGGEVGCKSAPGQGAVICATFPSSQKLFADAHFPDYS